MSDADDDTDEGCLYRPILFTDRAGGVWTPASVRFHTKTVLRFVVGVVFCATLAVTIVLAVNDAYNMSMFTLWSWTIFLAFSFVLWVALWVQHLLLTYVLLLFLPLVLSNVVFVAIAIVIIIANDSTVLTNNTPCATPPPADPKYTVSQVHTGDWIEHGWPPFATLVIVMLAGYLIRKAMRRVLQSFNPAVQWLYFVYWMCGTLVLLGIYDLAFDIAATYPTSFTTAQRVLILLGIVWVWQLFTWIAFTSKNVKSDVHLLWPASVDEFLATGRLNGAAHPSHSHAELLVPTTEELLGLSNHRLHELVTFNL